MIKQNRPVITIAMILVFAISLVFSFLFKSFELAVSGMLIVVVLTAFVSGWQSTLFAGLLSMVVMTIFVLYFKGTNVDVMQGLLSQIYSLLLIIFVVIIVFFLKQLQRRFSYEKAHMTSLFENATEGILLTDKEGKIVLVNPAAEKMFGYLQYELIGKNVEKLMPPRFADKHYHLREGYYAHPGNRSMGIGRDLYACRKDKTEFPVEISLSHYRQNNEPFVIAFIVDITTRKEIEKNLLRQKIELEKISSDIRRLNSELEGKVEERTQILKEALIRLEQSQKELNASLDKERQLNEIKSRFVSMASHEFRTPLSTILSSATLVSKYKTTDENEKRDKHIFRIRDSVNHMNELLEDFLSLGKLEEGKVGITASVFPVKDFVEDIVEEMKVQMKPGQDIDTVISGEANFKTDKRMLKNILLNLVSNAIKFSADGKMIRLECTCATDKLTLRVLDEGLGIPDEDKQHLFTTFFRAKNVSNIQGTGLGLPIVKRYVNLLHGEIIMDSKLGEGTSFTVTLPPFEFQD
jgi:PAS domain S-box-containing protein